MISFQFMKDENIVTIEPSGPLEQSDFEKLAREIGTRIKENNIPKGLLIHLRAFPGWENFEAFIEHVKFVKQHHKKIKRVAVATDSRFLTIVPGIAKHFVAAEIKHFSYDDTEAAKRWLQTVDDD